MSAAVSTASATRVRVALASLCGVQFIDVLGVTSTITALPVIIADLAAPPAATGVLATCYAAFFGGMLVLGARLGDRYGPRRVLAVGVVAFVLTSVVGATAAEIGQLLIATALRGAAAAISVPCALRLLLHLAETPATKRTAVAAWSACGALAGVLGYVVGGVLTQTLSWRAIYAINAPIGLLLLVGVMVTVPAIAADRQQRLDVPGAVLLVAAVMTLIIGAALLEREELRLVGVLAIAGGLVLAAVFVFQQRRATMPLVPPAAATAPALRTGSVIAFVITATTSSAGVLATLLLQQQRGFTPLQAALVLMPFSFAVIGGSVLSRRLAATPPRRLAGVGLAGIAAGNVVLVVTAGSVGGIVTGVAVAGLGLGLASVASTTIGTDVAGDLVGSAAGLVNTAAQLGTALGVSVLITVAAVGGPTTGTVLAWAIAAAAAALLSAVLLVRREGPGSTIASDERVGH